MEKWTPNYSSSPSDSIIQPFKVVFDDRKFLISSNFEARLLEAWGIQNINMLLHFLRNSEFKNVEKYGVWLSPPSPLALLLE